MASTFILTSVFSAVFGAIALEEGQSGLFRNWLRRRALRKDAAVAAPPIVTREGGWTLVRCDDPESFTAWLGKDEEGMPLRPGEEPSLGSHLLVEMYGCRGELVKREDYVGQAMRDAAVESKATVVAQSFHEFKPYGVSGAVIIQESHYTIHTWPEHGYAAVDLFYCGGTVLVHRALDVLRDRFQPEHIKFLVVRRGVMSEVNA